MITILSQRAMKYGLKAFLNVEKRMGLSSPCNELYLGYGANLSISRFEQNNMRAERIGNAELKDYKINFALPCEFAGKGFAGVEPSPGASVWGSLFKMNREALALLDVLEWVPFKFYRRVSLAVTVNGKTYENVWTYVPVVSDATRIPSTAYLQYLIKAAKEVGLPRCYIEDLEKQPSADLFEIDPAFNLANPAKPRAFAKPLQAFYQLHDRYRERLSQLIP